jgi:hypothetical protein
MIERANVILNCFALKTSDANISTVKALVSDESYRLHVKHFLQDPEVSITYKVKRLPKGLFEIHVASIDVSLDEVENSIEKVKDHIMDKERSSLELLKAKELMERALFKKLITKGWSCEYRHGYYTCYREKLGENEIASTKAPWLFTFYREYRYKTMVMTDGLYLFVEPRLRVEGTDFSSLLKYLGDGVLDEVISKGVSCIAYRESEKRYRRAVAVRLINSTKGRRVEVIYFDGEEAQVELEKVKLIGNVLWLKGFVTGLFGQEAYETYAQLQRRYSFSLGTKESKYTMGSEFKEESKKFIKNVRDSNVLPLRLSDVVVDVEDKPLEVDGNASREVW